MFQIRDISKVLESIPDDNDTILIGGQALNIWAEYCAQQDSSLNTHSPFFSHDIDFLGDRDTAAVRRPRPATTGAMRGNAAAPSEPALEA